MPMALYGKNRFEFAKINIRALPIIFRKCHPCACLYSKLDFKASHVIKLGHYMLFNLNY